MTRTVSRTYTLGEAAAIFMVQQDEIIAALEAESMPVADRARHTINQLEFESLLTRLKPYQIVTTLTKGDPVSLQELAALMKQNGAIPTPSGLRLQFSTLNEATAVMQRLVVESDSKYWTIAYPAHLQ